MQAATDLALQTLASLEERLVRDAPSDSAYITLLAEEARFGLRVIGPHLDVLAAAKPDAHVLEIGAGSLLLSCAVASCGLKLTALEPVGEGFDRVRRIQRLVETFAAERGIAMAVSTDSIEAHRPAEAYDFAFSINVYEHVDAPEKAVASLRAILKPDGSARIACPNYHVAYESHYSLPIIVNARVTRALFKNHIARYDQDNDCAGLWESLNFITSSDVSRYARRHALDLRFDKAFIVQMFARLRQESGIRARQGWIGAMALVADRLGLPHLIKLMPMQMHPYMVFDVRRAD